VNARIASMENLIARDPGGRNVFALMIRDQLRLAAQSLLLARRVGIVTGFFVKQACAGETDGPPGAVVLGEALRRCGITVDYITDRAGSRILQSLGVKPRVDDLNYLVDASPTHLVAIERVGRTHDGCYRNMKGEDISDVTVPLDRLFIEALDRGVVTIGIGDGGNEIGMGKVFASALTNVINGPKIASIVSTDYCIAAGVSNWGAYGLAAAMSVLVEKDLLCDSAVIVRHVETAVSSAGAVDGRTGERSTTVDGLGLDESVRIVEELRNQIRPSPFEDKKPLRIGVMGFGQTGRATARLLAAHGHRVFVSDFANDSIVDSDSLEAVETGGHSAAFLQQCDFVVTSPGVRPDTKVLAALRRAAIPIISDLEVADQLCEKEVIAVTGTTGKRTTVECIQHIFAASGDVVPIGGNKGVPLAAILVDDPKAGRVALAVSSFQLETVVRFRPRVAIILNAQDAHLDRHRSVAEYIRTKSRIFMNQRSDDVLIVPWDDARLRSLSRKHHGRTMFISASQQVDEGAWRTGDTIHLRINGEHAQLRALAVGSYPFAENLLAGVVACRVCGVSVEKIKEALTHGAIPGSWS